MKNNISIHIPKPCHENWEQMTPVDKGRFCQSCAKQVVDFSMMTDREVLNYLSKVPGSACGRFNNDQLQRLLQPGGQEKKKAWWIAAMMPLLMLFEKAGAQKTKNLAENIIKIREAITGMSEAPAISYGGATDYWHVPDDNEQKPAVVKVAQMQPPKYGSIVTAKRRIGDSSFILSGKVIGFDDKQPLTFATVSIKGVKTVVATDANGRFSIKGETYENQAILTINYMGFSDAEVLVNIQDTGVTNTVFHCTIKGIVTSAKAGQPVAFATISAKNTDAATASDMTGNFTFLINSKKPIRTVVVSSVGFSDIEVHLPAPDILGTINLGTIKMKDDTRSLDEIITTGSYITICKPPGNKDIIPTAFRKIFKAEKFIINPNPVQRGNDVTINIKNEGAHLIQLFDNNGNLITVKEFEATQNVMQTTLNVPASLNAGLYYVRLVDDKTKKQYTDKIVVM